MIDPIQQLDLSRLPSQLQGEVEARWARLHERAPETRQRAVTNPALLAQLPTVWACSPFVAKYCTHDPARFLELIESGDLEHAYEPTELTRRLHGALTNRTGETELMGALRRFRNREMVRIAWRDIAGTAGLQETMADLSRLAEAILDPTLTILHNDLKATAGDPRDARGDPQSMVIIAMGKLGAWELNFSSDIDLIFTYPQAGQTKGGPRPIDNQEFFTRLGRRLIKVLGDMTQDGFVFRVDMRLRPFSDSGPLVMSFAAMEEYYQAHASDWERYAMIKASIVAGDRQAGEPFMAMLQPFVFRRYLDFGAFQALREMKELIDVEVTRKGLQNDIKKGAGGIREIEFIGQTFQLIRGGREPSLRDSRILTILERLGSRGYLPDAAVAELRDAYVFLRQTEHRLQQIHDRQTQSLPADPIDRQRVATGMGFENWNDFLSALCAHRLRVAGHFAQLLNASQSEAPGSHIRLDAVWRGQTDQGTTLAVLEAAGFDDPPACCEAIRKLHTLQRRLSREARERLDRLMPRLIAKSAASENATRTLTRTISIVEAIARRSAYLSLLSENPPALGQLTRLCSASPWISGQIARQPILLDELLDPRTLYTPPHPHELDALLDSRLRELNDKDLELRMDVLRQFKHVQVLRVAAADIAGSLPVSEVSNHLSAIAEAVLKAALDMAWSYLVERHGKPSCLEHGQRRPAGFAIVAYGKLGGLELGYGSDLDLVFLHDSRGDQQLTDGKKPIDNNVFFSRLAQRVIHFLSTVTSAGLTYEIDTRLRPSGASGLLVSNLDSYAAYQDKEAWTWEHQALVRARPVAGDAPTRTGFTAVRRQVLARPREPAKLRLEIADMRDRMRRELCAQETGVFDLKQGRGGITDIEFMVQYAVLRWAAECPELIDVTDNLRLLETLARVRLLSADDCATLRNAYFAYRADTHRLALQELPPLVSDTEHRAHRKGVIGLWQRVIEARQETQKNDDG